MNLKRKPFANISKNLVGKIIEVLFITLIFLFVLGKTTCFATNKKQTKIKIKAETINNGTGVKVTVGKTGKNGLLRFYIIGCGDAYKEYKNDDVERLLTKIETDGKKNEKYIIKGLPEGTYSFRVLFEEKVIYEYEDMGETFHSVYYAEPVYSKLKKVNISKGNDKRQEKIKYDFSSVKKGDIIKFGAYEQDDDMTNGKEAIEWIVMSKKKDKILVASKYALDCLPYNKDNQPTIWQDSSLRAWLNKEFYETAFDDKERKVIQKTRLATGGTETEDCCFLISEEDASGMEYDLLKCSPSKYARTLGTGIGYEEKCSWYLRESSTFYDEVRGVSGGDSRWKISFIFCSRTIGIRPAMYLRID